MVNQNNGIHVSLLRTTDVKVLFRVNHVLEFKKNVKTKAELVNACIEVFWTRVWHPSQSTKDRKLVGACAEATGSRFSAGYRLGADGSPRGVGQIRASDKLALLA